MDKFEESFGFLISDITRLMRRWFEKHATNSSLTLAQSKALVYISHSEGVRQIELADLLDVQPITLARMIDQLAAMQMVERRPDPSDRRAHLIYLLPKAQEHLVIIEQIKADIRKVIFKDVSKAEEQMLLKMLAGIRGKITADL